MNSSRPPSPPPSARRSRSRRPPERAFDVFTAGMDGWWNRSHHVLPGTLRGVGVEPRVGGAL
jgi:hypothetical protein